MPLIKPLHILRTFLIVLCLTLAPPLCLAWAEEDIDDTLGLFNAWQEHSSTASRAPKPLSQTAENVTVVTAKDIEAINAHTLADVLDTIPGIQLQHNGGPGISTYTLIQSAEFKQILVFVDGISVTNLVGNFSEISLIPARIIERVEIIKGAASSSWGQALGGVINVITKLPNKERGIGGTASATIGERTTTDNGVELSGTIGRVGYYLSGGFLGSAGLLPGTDINANSAHAKLTYDLPSGGQIFGFFNNFRTDMGDLYIPYIVDFNLDLKEKTRKNFLLASLGLRQPLGEKFELELTGRHSYLRSDISWYNISDNAPWSLQPDLPTGITKEMVTGTGAKLIWRDNNNLIVGGGDYEHIEVDSNTSDNSTANPFKRKFERWDLYLNDTLTIGQLSFTPGVRLDHTKTNGDQFSSSLGATWKVSDETLLRAYTGRGFGVPEVAATDKPAILVWTSQIGAETTTIPYLWLKGTLFRNQVWGEAVEQHIALGTELEARTSPVWNTSLGAGYTFTETTRTKDGGEVNTLPRHTVQLALRYNDSNLSGVLTGRHIFWNSQPDKGRYGGLIWDLHLGATLLKRENSSLELFFSGRNLFNGKSYYNELIPNVGRWFEGGVRVRF